MSGHAPAAPSDECASDSARDLISLLRRRALRISGSESEAWDLVQDTIERALRRWPKFWAEPDARKWLMVVLRNLHIDHIRSSFWRASVTADADAVDRVAATDEGDAPLWKTVDIERVEAGLSQLSGVHRRMLLMQVDGKSLREIGEALGINPATVGTQLFRAKRQMRAILGLPQPADQPRRRKRRRRCRDLTLHLCE